MEKDKVSKITEKFLMPKLVNFIFGRRLCQKCARKLWKNEKEKTVLTLLGICENCHKGGIVGYLDG